MILASPRRSHGTGVGINASIRIHSSASLIKSKIENNNSKGITNFFYFIILF